MPKRLDDAKGRESVDEYIAKCPREVQRELKKVRAVILQKAKVVHSMQEPNRRTLRRVRVS